MLQMILPDDIAQEENMYVSIYNVNQQQVISLEWQAGAPINIQQLQSGYYLLRLSTRSAQWTTKICKM
mgnify:CR=1 FL=1